MCISPWKHFLGSLWLRSIFLPVIILFLPLVGFLFHSVDSVLQWSFRNAAILSVLVLIAGLILHAQAPSILDAYRFSELPSLPKDWSNAAEKSVDRVICRTRRQGLSAIEAIELAFGGYDVTRSETAFNRQLDFFFGEGATDRMSCEVEESVPDVPMVIYNVSGTIVFGMGGFATGRESLIQLHMLAQYYVTPFVLDFMPWYHMIRNNGFQLSHQWLTFSVYIGLHHDRNLMNCCRKRPKFTKREGFPQIHRFFSLV
jgi:hypothetical protein